MVKVDKNIKYFSFKKITNLFSNKLTLLIILLICVFMIGYTQLDITMPLVANHLSPNWGIMLIYIINSLFIVFLGIPLTNSIKSINEKIIIFISFILLSFAIMIYAFEKLKFIVIGIVLLSLAEIIFFPSLDSIISKNYSKDSLGKMFGIAELGAAIGGGTGNIYAGYFYNYSNSHFNLIFYWLVLSFFITIIGTTTLVDAEISLTC